MRGTRSRRWLVGVAGAVAATALTATFTATPALAAVVTRPAMLVNGNYVEIAVPGPNNSLEFYYAENGSPGWNTTQVTGAGSAFSAPSMAIAPGGYVDIAVEGPGNSLDLYYAAYDGTGPWYFAQVAGAGTTFSAPSIVISGGTVYIAADGPDNSLDFYWAVNGSGTWNAETAAGAVGLSVAPPAMAVNDGYVNIATESTSGGLYAWWVPTSGPLSEWSFDLIGFFGSTASAPSIMTSGDILDISTTSPNNAVLFYWAFEGAFDFSVENVSAANVSAGTSIAADNATSAAIIASTGPNGNLEFFSAVYGTSTWTSQVVSGAGSVSSAPVINADSFNGYHDVNISAVGPQGQLLFYYSAFGSGTWYSETIAGPGSSN
jgi:hypothetical protein